MNHSGAVFCGYKVAGNNLKSFFGVIERLQVGHELLIADPDKLFSGKLLNYFVRNRFVTWFIIRKLDVFVLFGDKC